MESRALMLGSLCVTTFSWRKSPITKCKTLNIIQRDLLFLKNVKEEEKGSSNIFCRIKFWIFWVFSLCDDITTFPQICPNCICQNCKMYLSATNHRNCVHSPLGLAHILSPRGQFPQHPVSQIEPVLCHCWSFSSFGSVCFWFSICQFFNFIRIYLYSLCV